MSRVITMKTIAAHAGVTQATVSMSLANNPRIPLVTRERIKSIAESLGYRPNPYLSALMRIRRRGRRLTYRPVLALVNGMATRDGWRTTKAPTVRQMLEGAVERATERGYRGQEFWLHQDDMSNDRFSDMLYARGIQGVVLSPLAEGAEPPTLKWQHFAAVCLSVPLSASTITTVCNDHYFSALQVVRECHRLGYRRPGLVIRRIHRDRFHARWDSGFQAARHLVERLTLAQTLVIEDWDDLSGLPAWLDRQKPDVVVSPSSDVLPDALRELGYRIPEDIGVASLACPRKGHPVSGVYQNGRLIGATAVDSLISMIERNERGLPEQAMTQMIEGVWNPGHTLRQR